jgi:hypothetical protein
MNHNTFNIKNNYSLEQSRYTFLDKPSPETEELKGLRSPASRYFLSGIIVGLIGFSHLYLTKCDFSKKNMDNYFIEKTNHDEKNILKEECFINKNYNLNFFK